MELHGEDSNRTGKTGEENRNYAMEMKIRTRHNQSTYAFFELVAYKLFEHRPHHVEQERLTDNVYLLQT